MLTNALKQGDTVFIIGTRQQQQSKTVVVEKVGKKYLYVLNEKFDFTGKHINDFPCYALWDNEQVYKIRVQRRKNIAKITQIINAYDFGKALNDEILEQILMLIEPKTQS